MNDDNTQTLPSSSQTLDLLPLNISIPNHDTTALTQAYFHAYKLPSSPEIPDSKKQTNSVFRGRVITAKAPITQDTCIAVEISDEKDEFDNCVVNVVQCYDSVVEWGFPEDSSNVGSLAKSVEWFQIADALHSDS